MLRRYDSRSLPRAARVPSFENLESRRVLSTTAPTVTDVSVASSSWDSSFLSYLTDDAPEKFGYSIPVGSALQSNPLPWSNIDQISIRFSEDVDVQASDLSVSGVANNWYAIDEFFYDPEFNRATWTLANALADEERVHLDLDSDGSDPVTDLQGNVLDGEWLDEFSSFPSGDGTAGGDFEFRLNVITGDHHATGLVDLFDYYATYYAVGLTTADAAYDPMYDNDGSGVIEASDWQAVNSNMGGSLPTGTPAGMASDAPTTSGFSLAHIIDRSIETRISLHDAFSDLETSDSSLQYSIVSQSNGSLFDSVSIDASAGEIVLAPTAVGSGRNRVVIEATDASGLSVRAGLTADLDHDNSKPVLTGLIPVALGGVSWQISGTVQDADDSVAGLIVEFSGEFSGRAAVQEDGSFTYKQDLSGAGGDAVLATSDPHGLESDLYFVFVGA